MQIVIDIPEDVIESAKSSPNYYPTYHFEKIWRAIVNGTPLPKGHGRLIDADKLLYEDIECTDGRTYMVVNAYDVDNAPTIIEADKESEDKK